MKRAIVAGGMPFWYSLPGLSDHWWSMTEHGTYRVACDVLEIERRGSLWPREVRDEPALADVCPTCLRAWRTARGER